ncbi:MAG: hypothetical protein V1834_02945, partial [Candidatus Micrarchaeota archaeon]
LEHLSFFNGLMEENGGKKPLWVTEFGTYSGTPSNQPMQPAPGGPQPQQQPPQPASSSSTQTEGFQAAWYFKNSIAAFANGASRLFIDLTGRDNDAIGSSALFNAGGAPRAFAVTLETIAEKLAGFSQSREIGGGQYEFTVSGKRVYALWNGALPAEVSGRVKVTGFNGLEKTVDSSQVELRADEPVFVEPA